MANQWLRLWHEMPNDPKWRTIARASSRPISLVQALYLHLLVDASRNVTRGHATVTPEDLASALDVTEEDVTPVLAAMQGRVLDGMRLLGWDARQPKREDSGDETTGVKSAAQRKKEQREREKLARDSSDGTHGHEVSRTVTLDKEKDKEKEHPTGGGGGEPAKPTKAGEICRAIKAKGVVGVNPSNPELLALIEKGVPTETFEAAAEICAKATPPKGMGYLLGIVKRQLTEAAGIAAGVGMPVKQWDENRATIEAKGIELGLGMWNANDISVNRETFPQYTERVRRAMGSPAGATA